MMTMTKYNTYVTAGRCEDAKAEVNSNSGHSYRSGWAEAGKVHGVGDEIRALLVHATR